MRILYVCADYGIPVLGGKGASVHVREMVAAMARAGHQVLVTAPMTNKGAWETPAEIRGRVLPMPGSETLQSVVRNLKGYLGRLGVENSLPSEVRRILYDQELESQLFERFDGDAPDFIYARGSAFSVAGVALARDLKRPLLVELNAPLAAEQAAYRIGTLAEVAAQAERALLTGASAVLTVSGALKEHVVRLGVPAQSVHVFPNAVDPQRFRPGEPDAELRRRFGLGEGPLMGFVGGLRPWHGVEALPGLLERLAARHPGLRLVIVGDGPLRAEIERSLKEKGLAEKAVLTGARPHDEVAELTRQFDIALAPYPPLQHEFYFSPLKLFEYLASGVPVVAAEVGQIAEVVRSGETGFLYPAGDLDALAACCDRLLSDPAARRAMGRKAAEEMHAHYTWDHNARRAVDLARALGAPG